MWYAVQVRTGEEEKTKLLCNKMISKEILEECFIPYYEQKKKYVGKWHITNEILWGSVALLGTDAVTKIWRKNDGKTNSEIEDKNKEEE